MRKNASLITEEITALILNNTFEPSWLPKETYFPYRTNNFISFEKKETYSNDSS